MGNVYVEKELKRIRESASAREKQRQKRLSHQRNVDAVVDFASALLKLSERGGAVKSFLKESNKALERLDASMRDYKGKIAGSVLRAHFMRGKK